MPDNPIDEELHRHLLTVLSVSAAMVGVCLTAIGLLGIRKSILSFETICDDLLAVDAIIFLAVSLLSFLGLRSPLRRRSNEIAVAVDVIFVLALSVMAVACALLVWFVV